MMNAQDVSPLDPSELFAQVSQVTGGFLNRATQLTNELLAKVSPDIRSMHTKQEPELLTIEMALPGYAKGDVSVEADGGTLIISAVASKDSKLSFYALSNLVRELPLPKGARSEKMVASFLNGVLRVTVPVSGTPSVRVTVT